MGMNIGYLELRYSGAGGHGEAASRDSRGGVMSSTLVGSQSVAAVSALAGATIKFASGHNVSAGGNLVLSYDRAAGTLAVGRAGPGTFGVSVHVEAGTHVYRLVTPEGGAIHVSVNSAALPGANKDGTYTLSNIMNGMFDNISKVESFNGMEDYRCFYVTNTHDTESFYGVKIYVSALPTGGDTVYLAPGAEAGDGSTTAVAPKLTTENNPPAGANFVSALTANTAVLLASVLGPGQAAYFWVKRTIPAETVVGSVDDVCSFTLVAGV